MKFRKCLKRTSVATLQIEWYNYSSIVDLLTSKFSLNKNYTNLTLWKQKLILSFFNCDPKATFLTLRTFWHRTNRLPWSRNEQTSPLHFTRYSRLSTPELTTKSVSHLRNERQFKEDIYLKASDRWIPKIVHLIVHKSSRTVDCFHFIANDCERS